MNKDETRIATLGIIAAAVTICWVAWCALNCGISPAAEDAIKERGGVTVNVTRLNADGRPYFSSDRPVNHPSETQLDRYNFDYFIKAKSGEAAWVEQQVITLVEYLRGLAK